MDNLCHTLVGAALAQAGLKRRTRYGMATLLVGANLPDVDALTYVFGSGLTALSFRRGWTHGILAMALWPWVLAALVWGWHRLIGRRKPGGDGPPMRMDQVTLLAAVSILTHPILDYMNTYGMRWLMPFVNRWSYADGLFILDPWIWLVLGLGVALSARKERRAGLGAPGARARRPAVVALTAVAVYAAAMVGASALARRLVARQLRAEGSTVVGVMASPGPLNPFRRQVVVQEPYVYRFGVVNWLRRPVFTLDPFVVSRNVPPAARAAATTPEGKAFLGWARFPFFVVEPTGAVHIVDARYTLNPDARFGAVTLRREGR